jgi:hypothetical protein
MQSTDRNIFQGWIIIRQMKHAGYDDVYDQEENGENHSETDGAEASSCSWI